MSPSFSEWQRKFRRRFPSRPKPTGDTSFVEPVEEALALDKHSGSVSSGHEYSTIYASGHANLHLGDVHYHASCPSATTKEQLMAALHFPEMFKRFESIQDPHSDTFEWVLNPPERGQPQWSSFMDWLYQKGGLYWISGKPGSGKSVLTKYLAQCARRMWGKEDIQSPVVLSFWFWEAAHDPLERNLFGCLRSLLWQLLDHPRHGDSICEAISSNATFAWTLKRLQDALNNVLMLLARLRVPLLIFLDGLDECGDSARDVLKFATCIVKQHDNLKMCISSRPEPLFQVALLPYPHLRMQDLNKPDVYAIINQDLLQTPEFDLITDKEDQSQYLQDEIAYMAQGVLLWVRLVIRDLVQGIVDGDTVLELRNRLVKIPSELDGENGLYSFMLRRNAANSKSYLADAAFYLQLACHRRMSVIEFCLASNENLRAGYMQLVDGWERLHFELDCDRMARAVSARTAGLLEVTPRRGSLRARAAKTRCAVLTNILNAYEASSIHFIHRTARTYVLETFAGHQILAASTKSPDDIKLVCFETWLIPLFVLRSLESAALVGLPNYSRGRVGCAHYTDLAPETHLLKIKYTIEHLNRQSLLWTVPCQSLHWIHWNSWLPCPKLDEHRIDFGLMFASLGLWGLAKSEILGTDISDPLHMFHLLWSTLMGLSHYPDGGLDNGSSELCDEILRCSPDPNLGLTNPDGEQIPAFYPIAFSYELLHPYVEEKPIDSLQSWLQKASTNTRTTRCKPTMGQCNWLFFNNHSETITILLGAFSYVDVAPLLQLSTGEDCIGQHLMGSGMFDTSYIVLDWPRGAWKPKMYRLSPSDSVAMLQIFIQQCRDVGFLETDPFCKIGMIDISGDVLPILNPTRATELRSLSEVLQVLGKTVDAIHSFAAAEADRVRLTYDELIYRHWRSWMYGVDNPLLQQYQHVMRPINLPFSLKVHSH